MNGCICRIRDRRWLQDGTCAHCLRRIDEVKQLAPFLHGILCAEGTGLVLWRNPRGYDERARTHYGLAAGAGDYVGLWSGRAPAPWVEVEIKTPIGRLDPDQLARRDLIVRIRGIYAVVRSKQDADLLLAWLNRGRTRPPFVFAPSEPQ
jgi:hypothetical protein